MDPTMPYRVYSQDGSGRFLDIFFYDGNVSQGIGFGNTLNSSKDMVNAFDGVLSRSWRAGSGPPVVNIAVDGETFGHHKSFGDRTLAYALTTEAPARGYYVTSYEEYLDRFAPSWEAILKPGPNGEGTAWSCAHGVGRWYRDCGCSTGGPPEWNQRWRTPLREALLFLQGQADALYEDAASSIFKDVWAARDESVDLFIDGNTQEVLQKFMARHASTYLDPEQETRALKYLDLQRMTQHMFTSCGWFFADIAGREAQQVLRYAGKIMDLIVELGGASPEEHFLQILGEARSNIPSEGNGADVFRKHVCELRTTPRRLAAQHAMAQFVDVEPLTSQEGHFRVTRLSWERSDAGLLSLQIGRFLLHHQFTGEKFDLATAVLHLGEQHIHTAVGDVRNDAHYTTILHTLLSMLPHAYASDILRAIDQTVGPSFYTLDALSPEEKGQVLQVLFKPAMDRIHNVFAFVYEDTREQMEALQEAGMVPPAEYRAVAQFTLGARLEAEVLAQQGSRNMGAYRKAFQIVRNATEQGLKLDKARVESMFSRMLGELTEQLLENTTVERTRNLAEFILLAERLELSIPYQQAQEELFDLLSRSGKIIGRDPTLADVMEQLATRLWLAVGSKK